MDFKKALIELCSNEAIAAQKSRDHTRLIALMEGLSHHLGCTIVASTLDNKDLADALFDDAIRRMKITIAKGQADYMLMKSQFEQAAAASEAKN